MKKRSENGSRKDAKAAKSKKFETRSPCPQPGRRAKFETISNDQNKSNSKRASFGFGVLDFADLRFICLEVCFGFRYSDFGFLSLVACGSASLPP
jgi:hypothetical protein